MILNENILQLCAMLEADIDLSAGDASTFSVVAPRQGTNRSPITYEDFLGWYNGHFSMTLGRCLRNLLLHAAHAPGRPRFGIQRNPWYE
jgi:hypothetical protein